MTSRTILLLLLLQAAATPASAQGEARTLPTGGHYALVGIAWHTADRDFGLDGNDRSLFPDTASFRNATFGQTDISLYGEIGIVDWLTGSAETHFRTLVREARYVPTGRDSTVSASGLGDLWLRARIRLLDTAASQQASVTLGWKAPTGSPLQEIPLGTGVADYSIGAALRYLWTLEVLDGYAEVSTTYLLRLKAANELLYSFQFGVLPGRGLVLYGHLLGTHSSADFDGALANPGTHRINETLVGDRSYLGWELGVRLAVDRGLELGAMYGDRVSGRNTAASTSFGLFIAWHGP